MPEWSRRDLLRTSGTAAVAVPMSALVTTSASASTASAPESAINALESEQVMFVVKDAKRGEISILHGEQEVVVRDRDLVARIAKATAGARKAG